MYTPIRTRGTSSRPNTRMVPRLETLEDRTLLSTCHVNRVSDANSGTGMRGTLRFCINKVNDLPGPDTIVFHVTGTIKLTSDLTRLASDITMIGPGADMLAVNGNGSSAWTGPIFYIETGSTVAISGLTITNGYSDCCVPGGIYNRGTLTLKDSAVTKNYNFFGDPYGFGGGITNYGKMTISDSTVSENVVYFGNDGAGAGIFNVGAMQITNGTISGNYFAAMFCSPGAGIFNMGSLDVRFSTITKNGTECSGDYGSGIHNDGAGSVELYNTIVAGNVNGPDVYGSYRGRANLIGGDPMLGPLQYNGGHTQTHAVLPGSPALDAGDNTDAPEFDQRGPGFRRIVNGAIDIGAFEVQATGAPGTNDLAVLIAAYFGDPKLKHPMFALTANA